jgi:hypothetical protein
VVAEGDRVGALLRLKRCVYCFQHTREILVHVGIPEPQHTNSVAHEMPVAAAISRGVVVMIVLPAVDLDDQLLPQANEIDDVSVARRLAAEMKAALAP